MREQYPRRGNLASLGPGGYHARNRASEAEEWTMALVVYGIPTCGTCKKALAWLDARGLHYRWVDLRSESPSEAQVGRWVGAFGALALRNLSGGAYRALGEAKARFGETEWTAAFVADPMLIKRPVLERDGKPLIVGFRASDAELERLLG
jgi:arsenate reductase